MNCLCKQESPRSPQSGVDVLIAEMLFPIGGNAGPPQHSPSGDLPLDQALYAMKIITRRNIVLLVFSKSCERGQKTWHRSHKIWDNKSCSPMTCKLTIAHHHWKCRPIIPCPIDITLTLVQCPYKLVSDIKGPITSGKVELQLGRGSLTIKGIKIMWGL